MGLVGTDGALAAIHPDCTLPCRSCRSAMSAPALRRLLCRHALVLRPVSAPEGGADLGTFLRFPTRCSGIRFELSRRTARHERTLLAVRCSAWFGGMWQGHRTSLPLYGPGVPTTPSDSRWGCLLNRQVLSRPHPPEKRLAPCGLPCTARWSRGARCRAPPHSLTSAHDTLCWSLCPEMTLPTARCRRITTLYY